MHVLLRKILCVRACFSLRNLCSGYLTLQRQTAFIFTNSVCVSVCAQAHAEVTPPEVGKGMRAELRVQYKTRELPCTLLLHRGGFTESPEEDSSARSSHHFHFRLHGSLSVKVPKTQPD